MASQHNAVGAMSLGHSMGEAVSWAVEDCWVLMWLCCVTLLALTVSIYAPSELVSPTPFTMNAKKWVLLMHSSSGLKADV